MDTLKDRWYEALVNDDGETYFVNQYGTDDQGDTRRDTIADGLTQRDAVRLAEIMDEAAAIIAKSTFADLDL